MARRIPLSFFKAKDVLFVGYSRSSESFCASIQAAFEKSGSTTYLVNPNFDGGKKKIYKTIGEVPAKPELAYVVTNKSVTATLIDAIAAKGVRRVLFQSSMAVDKASLERCAKLGMEAEIACPMMGLGGGFHRFHGFLAGVRA